MTFQVYDCLSDCEVRSGLQEKEADLLCQQKGGNEKCIHVFPIQEIPEVKSVPKSEEIQIKPRLGELF